MSALKEGAFHKKNERTANKKEYPAILIKFFIACCLSLLEKS